MTNPKNRSFLSGFSRSRLLPHRTPDRATWLGAVAAVLLLAAGVCASAQDIVLSDFEQSTYSWLPGGTWTVTGTAFGSGPAQGTLPNQTTVDGFLGHGLVNTYLNGDGSTGTLTSPAFTIQRKYIRFLIGGGNRRNQTCMNLLINGQVVRSAVGMGDREHLDWLQWNVSAFMNQTALIQIVDSTSSGWGHINVDQIIETDTSLSSVITATNHYLNLPIRTGATKHLVELVQDGLVIREMNVELADTTTNFWSFMDLTPVQGSELVVRVDSQLATTNQLATFFVQTSSIIANPPIYQESLRPVYHYTARRGWMQDPNGLVYYKGEYHMFYQHNPYGCYWDNMHWGHAVSTNLVQWTELPEALYPTYLGECWSGSSVVDWNNSAGLGVQSILSFYTSAAGVSGETPRMSGPYNFAQSMACSTDSARTFINYSNNPVLPNVVGLNHDPKVFWYAPGNKWVMVLYLQQSDYGIFNSSNLINWVQTSTFTLTNATEVPDLFPLPLDGNTNNLKWIFSGGYDSYCVGTFNGSTFAPQYGPFSINKGTSFGATQTFNGIPAADGRTILMVLGETTYPGMPFNELMNLPVELTLVSNGVPKMYVNPVRELALLRTSTNTWPAQPLPTGTNILNGVNGEAFEVDLKFQPGSKSQVVFSFGGNAITYDNARKVLTGPGVTQNLSPVNGTVHLRMFYDRGIIDVFGNDGQLYMPVKITPASGQGPLSLTVSRTGVQLVLLNIYNLGSTWPAASLAGSSQLAGLASVDNRPLIQVIGQRTNGFAFQWTCPVSTNFLVQWVARLGDPWQTIATLPNTNDNSFFMDTNSARLNGSAGFYRVQAQ